MSNGHFVVLLISVVACAKTPTSGNRSALSEESKRDAPEQHAPRVNAASPVHGEAIHADPLASCTATPVVMSDASDAPIALSAGEQNRLAFIDDFVRKNAPSANASTRVPPDVNGSPHELTWDIPSAKYERARLWFEKRHYAEAALAFREFTLTHHDRSEAVYTSQLYLEALNLIAERAKPQRPECIDAIGEDLGRFKQLFCKTPVNPERREYCRLIQEIETELPRIRRR